VNAVPATIAGTHRGKVSNAQFAMGIAYGLGVARETIIQGLTGFTSSFEQNPGRFNILDQHPFRVIVDKASGAEAMRALADAARAMPATGRKVLLLTAPGKHTDDYIRDMGRAAAGAFDRYICAAPRDTRYRPPHEAPILLAEGLLQAGVDPSAISRIVLDDDTLPHLLAEARAGDLIVISTRPPDWAIKQVSEFREAPYRAVPALLDSGG
jgi:cyanophycin synthetase